MHLVLLYILIAPLRRARVLIMYPYYVSLLCILIVLLCILIMYPYVSLLCILIVQRLARSTGWRSTSPTARRWGRKLLLLLLVALLLLLSSATQGR